MQRKEKAAVVCKALVYTLFCSTIKAKIFIPPKIKTFPQQLFGLRASSAPYISGDTFRAFSDFIIDETRIPFDPNSVSDGDTIFLKTDLLDYFFKKLHPLIKKRYILITHNSDFSAPGNYADYLDDKKLVAWFAQNVGIDFHPKLFVIPIGIANRYLPHGDITTLDEILQNRRWAKKYLLYANFELTTSNGERQNVKKLFLNKTFCYHAQRKPWKEYLREMAQSKFVLSPMGNGLDCHRTWEALLLGTIPIVKHSSLDSLYENLPVLIINEWDEITEEFLLRKYAEITAKSWPNDKLCARYWINRIENIKSFLR